MQDTPPRGLGWNREADTPDGCGRLPSRAKNTALDKGLENWQNSHFLEEKVTRKPNMPISRCWCRLGDQKPLECEYVVRLDCAARAPKSVRVEGPSADCEEMLSLN
jgi:hypothetical protein